LTTSAAFPSTQFTPITWRASATGGPSGSYLYRFWRLKVGVGWTLAQDYSTYDTYTRIPQASDVGPYLIQVWVKSASSGELFDGWASGTEIRVLPAPPPRLTSLTSDVPLPPLAGTPVTWTAVSSGGSGSYTYRFFLLDKSSGQWTELPHIFSSV